MLPTKALELGETIRAARNRKGWSLDKLSEVSGVSATYISQIETASPASMTGKIRRPSMQKLDALIAALEIDRTTTLHLAGWSSDDDTPQQAPSLDTTQVLARVLRHYQDGSLPDEQQADLDSLSPFFRRLLRHIPNSVPNDEIVLDDDEAANINSPHNNEGVKTQ